MKLRMKLFFCSNQFKGLKLMLLFLILTMFANIYIFNLSKKHISVALCDCNKVEKEGYLIYTHGCKIPKLDPFDPSVSTYYWEKSSLFLQCHKEGFLIVEGDKVLPNTKVMQQEFRNKKLDCIYQPIIRDPDDSPSLADHTVGLGKPNTLNFNVAIKDEYLKVKCSVNNKSTFIDYLALMLLKPNVEKKCNEASEKYLGPEPLNIIILAVDSTSKLNFMRHFPITYGFLKTEMKAFEFHGHTKVADNTFPNIVPMTTGHFVNETAVKETYLDDLQLIWKEFAAMGYRTFFIEEEAGFGTFNFMKKGFKKQATDYYLRPFALTAEKDEDWMHKNGHYCMGHTSETEFFYDYFKKFVKRMDNRPFFAFTFVSRPTHNDLNAAGFADLPTFNLFQELMSSNVLNNSVLIFFSDHGIRFASIRKTYIGKVEERMPFMFQFYPEWFLKKYPAIQQALKINQKRLTTPFDVHKTLQDIVVLSSKDGVIDFRKKNPGFGQSLFTEISERRTCDDAHIAPHYCTCHQHIKLANGDSRATEVANELILTVNQLANSRSDSSLCVIQYVKDIIDVYVSMPEKLIFNSENNWDIQDYLTTVRASPSNAVYEGTLRFAKGKFNVIGDISRINSYGNQSWCMESQVLKKFCFCKE